MYRFSRYQVTATLFVMLLTLLVGTAFSNQAEEHYVTVLKMSGDVRALDSDGGALDLAEGVQIPEGSTITTGSDGYIELIWGEAGWARLDKSTSVFVQSSRYKKGETSIWARLKLTVGQVWFDLLHQVGDIVDFTVETPTITAGVRGTAFSVQQFADGSCQVSVQRGLVAATSELAAVDVGAEQYAYFDQQGMTDGVHKWSLQMRQGWELMGENKSSFTGSDGLHGEPTQPSGVPRNGKPSVEKKQSAFTNGTKAKS